VLERIFSEDKIDAAREQVELTQVFAEEAYRVVGDLYRDLETAEAALERAKAEDKSEQEIQQLEALIGSIERRYPVDKATAHALVGGITAVLGGGDFLTGAVAAGVSEASAQSIAAALPEQEVLQNLAAALIGGTLGGSQGALITANANQFNRQLHPNEIELILENADKFAQQIGVSDIDLAISILTDAALDQIDLNWSETDNPSVPGDSTQTAAIAFLQELSQQTEAGNRYGVGGRWFTSTEEAFVNPEIYADLVFSQRDNVDTTGFDAVEYPEASRDYKKFYDNYAKAHIHSDAIPIATAVAYATEEVKNKGLAVAGALAQKETYEQILQGIENIVDSNNPLVYAAEAQLKGLQADHGLKEALDAVEVHAVLAELQGDLDTAARLRGQAAAEIAVAQVGASGVGLGAAATAKLTVKMKSLAEAAKLKVADNNSKLEIDAEAEQVASGETGSTVQGGSDVPSNIGERPPAVNPSLAQLVTAEKLGVDPRWVKSDGTVDWPTRENSGFDGGFSAAPKIRELQLGQTFDRYGGRFDENGNFSDRGSFVAPDNVPFDQRSLPDSTQNAPYRRYEVIRPIPKVNSGTAGPWFGKPGGGVQYQLPMSIDELVNKGFIKPVN